MTALLSQSHRTHQGSSKDDLHHQSASPQAGIAIPPCRSGQIQGPRRRESTRSSSRTRRNPTVPIREVTPAPCSLLWAGLLTRSQSHRTDQGSSASGPRINPRNRHNQKSQSHRTDQGRSAAQTGFSRCTHAVSESQSHRTDQKSSKGFPEVPGNFIYSLQHRRIATPPTLSEQQIRRGRVRGVANPLYRSGEFQDGQASGHPHQRSVLVATPPYRSGKFAPKTGPTGRENPGQG